MHKDDYLDIDHARVAIKHDPCFECTLVSVYAPYKASSICTTLAITLLDFRIYMHNGRLQHGH